MELVEIYFKNLNKFTIITNFLTFFLLLFFTFSLPVSGSGGSAYSQSEIASLTIIRLSAKFQAENGTSKKCQFCIFNQFQFKQFRTPKSSISHTVLVVWYCATIYITHKPKCFDFVIRLALVTLRPVDYHLRQNKLVYRCPTLLLQQ